MKFYRDKNNNYYLDKIYDNKLTAIYGDKINVQFHKNGEYSNNNNASIIFWNGYKQYFLKNKHYGDDFDKKSWRRFLKLQAFK